MARGLKLNSNLKTLSLGNNIVDVPGALELAEALTTTTSTTRSSTFYPLLLLAVTYVDLKQNLFDSEGDIALVEAMINRRKQGMMLH